MLSGTTPTLQSAIAAYNQDVSTITTSTVQSIVGQEVGVQIPLIGDITLDQILSANNVPSLSQDLLNPLSTALSTAASSWSSVISTLQSNLPAGATISSILPFTGNPNSHGNLLEINYQQTISLAHASVTLSGASTGFSYLDGNGNALFGIVTGSVQATINVTMGLDCDSSGNLHFFVAQNSNIVQATVNISSSDNGISGTLAIGDLATVNATATGTIKLSGSVGLQSATGKVRASDLTSNLGSVLTSPNFNGSVILNANFDAQLSGLPDVIWTGTFGDQIVNNAVQSPTANLQEPSASQLLSSLGSSLFSLGDGIPILGNLTNTLNQPLPLINESLAQLTGLDQYLPTLPSLPSNFVSMTNGSGQAPATYPLAGGTLTLNVNPTTIDEFLKGQSVDLFSWNASGGTTFINENYSVPIYSFGVPDVVSAEIDANFGITGSIQYHVGFGLDGHGFWIRGGDASDPTLGLTFGITAGIEGRVEVFGFNLATAGGDLGFSVTPYVTLFTDPYSPDPRKVYMNDLALFGSNPLSNIVDDLSFGIEGDLTGDIYAQSTCS